MQPTITDRQIRSFARGMALGFIATGVLLFISGLQLAAAILWVIAAILYAAGVARPQCLIFFYTAWMFLAKVLAWVTTRTLLILFFIASLRQLPWYYGYSGPVYSAGVLTKMR